MLVLLKKLLERIKRIFSSSIQKRLMNEQAFTNYFCSQLKEKLNEKAQVIEPLQIKIEDSDGWEYTSFLGNAYSQYISQPASLVQVINNQLRTIKARKNTEIEKGKIFAVIKPVFYLEEVRKQLVQIGATDNGMQIVYKEINLDLLAFYVVDTETGMRSLMENDLSELDIAEENLHAIALSNLEKYFAYMGVTSNRIENIGNAKVYHVTIDDNYEASTILLNNYWIKDNFDIDGDFVVFIPARNVLLVTGSEDIEGLQIGNQIAKEGFSELAYHISPRGYILQNTSWLPFIE